MSVKITTLVQGVERLRRELQLAQPHTQQRVATEIKKSTQTVTAGAQARAPRRTGELTATIRDEYGKDGLSGFVKAGYGQLERRSRATTDKGAARFAKVKASRAARRVKFLAATSSRAAFANADLGVYASVVEHGDSRTGRAPHPFLIPPFTSERPHAIENINKALNATVEDIGRGAS
jgi:hypothetical protein